MALRGNTIVAVGLDQDVSTLIGTGTRIVDLDGRVVLPGIIDAHTHPAATSQNLDKCNLGDTPITAAELRAQVTKCLTSHPGSCSR